MSVKIWDAQSNAFKDAETPKIWDAEAGAYKDSTGLVWNESAQAWDERWSGNKYEQTVDYVMLYDRGDENVDFTGGIVPTYYLQSDSCVKNADNLQGSGSGSATANWRTTNKFDSTEYRGIGTLGYFSNRYSDTITALPYFGVTNNTTGLIQSNDLHVSELDEIFVEKNNIKYACGMIPNTSDKTQYYYILYRNFDRFSSDAYYKVYDWFIYREDEYKILANMSGISNYSVDVVLANSSEILNKKDSVNFMVRRCTGVFMVQAVMNTVFLSALKTSAYKDIVYSNKHWNKFLNMANYAL